MAKKAKDKKTVSFKKKHKNPGGRIQGMLGGFLSAGVWEDMLRGLGMFLIRTVANATVKKEDYANLNEYQKAMLVREGLAAGAGTFLESHFPPAFKQFLSPVLSGARTVLVYDLINKFVGNAVDVRVPEDGKETWKSLLNWYQSGSGSISSNADKKQVSLLENLMDFKYDDEKNRQEAALKGLKDEEVSFVGEDIENMELYADENGNVIRIPVNNLQAIQGEDEEVSNVS